MVSGKRIRPKNSFVQSLVRALSVYHNVKTRSLILPIPIADESRNPRLLVPRALEVKFWEDSNIVLDDAEAIPIDDTLEAYARERAKNYTKENALS